MKHLLTGILLLFAWQLHAQDTLGHQSANERTAWLTLKLERELNLSPTQTQEVKQILQERSLKLAALGEAETKKQMPSINKTSIGKLKKCLSPEQYETLQALREERKARMAAYKAENPQFRASKEDEELDF